MRKRAAISISFFLVLNLIWLVFIYNPVQGFAAVITTEGKRFGIATNPPNSFLNMHNMAPGDSVTDDLAVLNDGEYDFNYTISASQEAGDTDLYNLLLLDLVDAQGTVLYSGVLSGLFDLDLGSMEIGSQEVFNFTVIFPDEAGNEFQGKGVSVQFVFAARSHKDDIGTGTGVIFEHPVINNQFKLKIDSSVPIKFHLIDAQGNLIRTKQENVSLEVFGPDPDGIPVTYTFGLADSSLAYDGKLKEPHYLAKFSTKDYPVQPGGWYTATVYENGIELGSITFQADTQPDVNRSNSKNL